MPGIRRDRFDRTLCAVERLRDIFLPPNPEVAVETPAKLRRPLFQLLLPDRHVDQRAEEVGLDLAQRGRSWWVGAIDVPQRIIRVLPSPAARPAPVIPEEAVATD